MEPWGYVGGALPGWAQHPAAPGVDQKRGRGERGIHPPRHGKVHHPHPGAAPHESASPEGRNS